jgi:hypothetical protein
LTLLTLLRWSLAPCALVSQSTDQPSVLCWPLLHKEPAANTNRRYKGVIVFISVLFFMFLAMLPLHPSFPLLLFNANILS